MERCPTQDQLQALLADQLSTESVATIEAHVEECADCQGALDKLIASPLSFRAGSSDAKTQRVAGAAEHDKAFLRRLAAKSVDMTWRGPADDKVELREPSQQNGSPPAPPPVVGFRVLEVLGRGGMGIVYKAEHLRLKRVVALKMILSAGHSADGDRARFRVEAEAAARLQHPNIVQVFEVGEQDSNPYLVLEYINGGNLAEMLRKASLSPRQSAELVGSLARAIHHAHQHGIIHRDLKPSNILLQRDNADAPNSNSAAPSTDTLIADEHLLQSLTPKITDFGLAKLVEGGLNNTQSGSILGTPAYMAPEQADGRIKDIGIAVDIYALGCILYELLTGKPPFQGKTVGEILQQVMTKEPIQPYRLSAQVPRDLSIICSKCLEKEPKNRYASAAEFAEDLRRFLADEPITARPHSLPSVVLKWTRRRPAAALLVVVLLLAAIALISGDLWYQARLQGLLSQVTHERDDASLARDEARIARIEADRKRVEAEEQRDLSQQNLYLAHIPLAQRAWEASHLDRMRELLDSVRARDSAAKDLRNFEWYYLDRLMHTELRSLTSHAAAVMTVAIHPSGTLLASADVNGIIRLWNPDTGEEISPPLEGHAGRINSLAFSPNKNLLASAGADHAIRIWDLKTHQVRHTLKGHVGWVYGVSFHPDGSRLASCGADKTIKIWDVESEQAVQTLTGHEKQATGVAFSPDGKTLASCGADWRVLLWTLNGNSEPRSLKGHRGWVYSVAFSPDGKSVVSSSFDNSIRVWNVADGVERANFSDQAGRVRSVAFSLDGMRLASAGSDQTVRIWDVQKAKQIQVLRGHIGNVNCVAFHPDGVRVVSAGNDHTVRIWDSKQPQEFSVAQKHANGSIDALVFSRDGKHLVSGGADRTIYVWDMLKSSSEQLMSGHRAALGAASLSSDSKRLATGSIDKTVRIWDFENQRLLQTLEGHTGRITAVAFSPDDRRLASCSYDGTVRIWNVADGKPILSFTAHNGRAMGLAFSRDGKLIASIGGEDRTVRISDAATGNQLAALTGHNDWIHCIVFHPNGKLLATGSADGTIKLWDIATGEMSASLEGHSGRINSLAFTRDGTRLASAGFTDQTIKIWDVTHGQELLSLNNQSPVHVVAFSPDDKQLVSGGGDGIVRLWDSRSTEIK